MYGFLRIMRIAEVVFCFGKQLSVCKLSKIRQGLFLVGWTEVGPCELSTAVPVGEHVELVNPGQDL